VLLLALSWASSGPHPASLGPRKGFWASMGPLQNLFWASLGPSDPLLGLLGFLGANSKLIAFLLLYSYLCVYKCKCVCTCM
jgi:hypothetical protein